MKKEVEQSIFIDDEDGFVIEVILYKDGISQIKVYTEDGYQI